MFFVHSLKVWGRHGSFALAGREFQMLANEYSIKWSNFLFFVSGAFKSLGRLSLLCFSSLSVLINPGGSSRWINL